jgi:hypothetical protein
LEVFKFSFKGYITANLYSMLIGIKMVKGLTVRDARTTLIKNKIKFSSHIRKFRVERLHTHI